jgi:hypothetical protein
MIHVISEAGRMISSPLILAIMHDWSFFEYCERLGDDRKRTSKEQTHLLIGLVNCLSIIDCRAYSGAQRRKPLPFSSVEPRQVWKVWVPSSAVECEA